MAKLSQEKWWTEGLRLAVELTGWLVIPLLVALLGGKWLDQRYGTEPWLFLVSTGVAFVITCGGIAYKAMVWIKLTKNTDEFLAGKKKNERERE